MLPLAHLVLCTHGIVAYQSRTRQEQHLVGHCGDGTATEVYCLQLHIPQTKTLIPTHPQTLQTQTLLYGMRPVLPLSARRK